MKQVSWRATVLAILLLSIAAIVFAPTVVYAQTSKRLALVVGNDNYTQVTKLANARNDAKAMAAELKSAGFDVTSKLDVNYFDMVGLVGAFTQRIQPGDEVAVFFAGHGLQLKSGNFLLPVDIQGASEAVVERTALSLDDLMDQIKRAGPRFTLMVIDACRDNPFRGTGRNIGEGRGLRPPEPPKGQLVVFSASRGQQALDKLNPQDSNPNGVFTREFIKKMREKGVPVDQVARQVQETVEQLAAQAGKEQRPAIYNESRGNFYFYVAPGGTVNINPPAAPVRIQSAAEIEQQAWSDAQKADTIPAYEAYKTGFPKGRYVASANVAIARLKNAAPTAPTVAARIPGPTTNLGTGNTTTTGVTTTAPAASIAGKTFRDCAECPEMVVIPAGNFLMGSPSKEARRKVNEDPPRRVQVSAFAIGKSTVTQMQWRAVMGNNPSALSGCGDSCPVESVSWIDAQAFIQKLNVKTGKRYRLPSEAEWEYAARAGSKTTFYWGNSVGNGNANCSDCGSQWDNKQTAPVGSFAPNPFGLYDMAGNVSQWVEDCWHDNYNGAPTEGIAWTIGGTCARRVHRGGSWNSVSEYARSANRNSDTTTYRDSRIGFRVVRMVD
jgi:formylglycine-generating enzyme required for sulfatase activity